MANNHLFTVAPGADNQSLKCIDANTGVVHNSYRFVGTLVTGPVVTGNRVTIVIRSGNTNIGHVLALPSFLLTSTFQA